MKKEEKELIKRAQKGDQDAFTKLFQLHYAFLYKYLLKVTMNREITEDIVQETMVKCYENIQRYNGKSKFSSWLITIESSGFMKHLLVLMKRLKYKFRQRHN